MLDLAAVPSSSGVPIMPSTSLNSRQTFRRSRSSSQNSTYAPPQPASNNVIDSNAIVRSVEDTSHRIVAQLAKRRFVEAARSSATLLKAATLATSQTSSARTMLSNLAATVARAWFAADHPLQGLRLLRLIESEELKRSLRCQAAEGREVDVEWFNQELQRIDNHEHREFARQVWSLAEDIVPGCSVPVPTIDDYRIDVTWSLASGAFSIELDQDGDFVWAAADYVARDSASGQSRALSEILDDPVYKNWMRKILDVEDSL